MPMTRHHVTIDQPHARDLLSVNSIEKVERH
jgi:hypothetical protein